MYLETIFLETDRNDVDLLFCSSFTSYEVSVNSIDNTVGRAAKLSKVSGENEHLIVSQWP